MSSCDKLRNLLQKLIAPIIAPIRKTVFPKFATISKFWHTKNPNHCTLMHIQGYSYIYQLISSHSLCYCVLMKFSPSPLLYGERPHTAHNINKARQTALYWKFEKIFPEMELRSLGPNLYIHVSEAIYIFPWSVLLLESHSLSNLKRNWLQGLIVSMYDP